MLIEDCKQVEELNNKSLSVEKLKEKAAFLGRFQNELSEARKGLDEDIDRLILFNKNKILEKSDFPEIEGLMQTLKNLVGNVSADYSNINQGDYYAKLKNSLKGFHDSVNSLVNESWKNWVNLQLKENFSDSIIKSFSDLKPEVVNNILAMRQEFIPLKKRVPQNDDDLKGIINKIKTYNTLLDQLPFQGMPDEVRSFLEKLGSDVGAELVLLTPKVIKWLEEKKLFDELVIVTRVNKGQSKSKDGK